MQKHSSTFVRRLEALLVFPEGGARSVGLVLEASALPLGSHVVTGQHRLHVALSHTAQTGQEERNQDRFLLVRNRVGDSKIFDDARQMGPGQVSIRLSWVGLGWGWCWVWFGLVHFALA